MIKADPRITEKATNEQFEKLILEPLKQVAGDPKDPLRIIVVIDALDECDQEEDVKRIISLLSRAKSLTAVRLRVLVTSRPELHIRLGFTEISGAYTDLALHTIPESVVERDISAFLEYRMRQIRREFNKTVHERRMLPADWPGQTNIQNLVTMAVPLFIFAATACRFISDRDCGDPEDRLKTILDYQKNKGLSQLHATYLPILSQLLVEQTDSGYIDRPKNQKAEIVESFRQIVGAIVILADPLPTACLARLLKISEGTIWSRFDRLYAVLNIPSNPDAPVTLLHLSFRDFLVDPKMRDENPFWVDEAKTHEKLAASCLELLSESDKLKKDICGIQMPGKKRTDIDTNDRQLPTTRGSILVPLLGLSLEGK